MSIVEPDIFLKKSGVDFDLSQQCEGGGESGEVFSRVREQNPY